MLHIDTARDSWTVEECGTCLLLLFFLTHFYVPILEPVRDSLFAASADGQTLMGQVISGLVWVLAGALMLRRSRQILAGWRTLSWTALLVVFAVISMAWSQDPSLTLRKGIFLCLTTAFGIYFGCCYTMARQLRMICVSAMLISIASICFALFLPRYGLDHDVHEGVWVGVFTQKNVCARELLFLLTSLLAFSPATRAMRWCRRLGIAGTFAVIVGTRSKTALLIVVLVICYFVSLRLVRSVSRGVAISLFLVSCALTAIACAIAASSLPTIVTAIGRDGTMTGRTEIWHAVLQAIGKHPVLGYGFAAFWLSLRGESANIILALRWAVPAAHNGFLEIWLQLGAVGLALFGMGFVRSGHAAIRGCRQESFERAAWPLGVLLLTLVYNLDESSLLQINDFLWVIYVATLINVSAPAPAGASRAARVHVKARSGLLAGGEIFR